MAWKEICDENEIPLGKIKGFDIAGKKICIANVNRKFYAVIDRCGHQKIRLSRGNLEGTVITCPLHAAQFDVVTGKNLRGPQLGMVPGADKLPKEFLESFAKIGELISEVPVEPLETYETMVKNGRIMVNI